MGAVRFAIIEARVERQKEMELSRTRQIVTDSSKICIDEGLASVRELRKGWTYPIQYFLERVDYV